MGPFAKGIMGASVGAAGLGSLGFIFSFVAVGMSVMSPIHSWHTVL
jgi:hypothetical protein